MNLNFNQNLTSNSSTQQTKQGEIVITASSISDAVKNAKASLILNSLMQGQTISGQIKEINGSTILLSLGDNVEISAKTDSKISWNIGQTVLFEVKSNQNNKLSLSPLFTNTQANESTITNALQAAKMPITDENIAMVREMVQEGLSIDKGSLWEMNRLSSLYDTFKSSAIVELTAMGVNVTEGNLEQLEAYHNMRYQILDTITEVSHELNHIWQSFASENHFQEGATLMQEVVQAFSDKNNLMEKANLLEEVSEKATSENNTLENLKQADTLPIQTVVGEKSVSDLLDERILNSNDSVTKANLNLAMSEENKGLQPYDVRGTLQQVEPASMSGIQQNKDNLEIFRFLSQQKPEQLSSLLKEGNLKLEDILKSFDNILKQDVFQKEGAALTYETVYKGIQNLITANITNHWLIEPESFSDKEAVLTFYQRMQQQVGDMERILSSNDKGDTAAGKAVGNLQQNIDFLHAMNQVFPYIQIPLKSSLKNAHGDLYVYSKRKGKQEDDGSVSALLHLEMQYLGNLDIYVKLHHNNVTTHFYLEDASMLDFLEKNMEMLDAHLEKKGYHLNTEVSIRDKQQSKDSGKDVISHIRGKEEGNQLIAVTAFDVRA